MRSWIISERYEEDAERVEASVSDDSQGVERKHMGCCKEGECHGRRVTEGPG